ncbi:hypothetical protein GCM10022287_22530 [Gryllotalpicola koreensis]|uniref:Uncharacterized protein n=1 Tax=Gryllotalpicola koreensis TaxID=993086 RepID=A0ABP8A273_9MICO
MPEQEQLPAGEEAKEFSLFDLGFLDGLQGEPCRDTYRTERSYRDGWVKGIQQS